MKRLFDEIFVFECLLLAYFSNDKLLQRLITPAHKAAIEKFLEIVSVEDNQKGTRHAHFINEIYSNPQYESRDDFHKELHISKSTLQRYREKYCSLLKCVLENSNINEAS